MESTIGKRQGRSERNDAIVTARVPAEIKKQGNAVLREIGSTPTELVNAAYRYVLRRESFLKKHLPLPDWRGSIASFRSNKKNGSETACAAQR